MEVEKRDGISMGHQDLFKIPETCEYLKPKRRKSVEREGDADNGRAEGVH